MTGHRWSKFWWQDWQSDPGLRACSLAARGLWMEMLCFMAGSERPGYLLVAGQAPDDAMLGRMFGVPRGEISRRCKELERNGVFSRDDGTIVCRRMVRDAVASEAGRENVAKRWKTKPNGSSEPAQNGQAEATDPNRGPTRDPNRPPTRGACSLEAEAEAEERTLTSFGRSVARRAGGESARSKLWVEGVPVLQRLTGKPERGAKSLLGLVLTRLHDDCAKALALIREVDDLDAADPAAWLLAAARPPPKPTAAQRHADSMRETLRIFGLLDDDDEPVHRPPVTAALQ